MKKVVIIGAGPAGLTAAYELLKRSKDYEVVIIEESSQVGGLSKTINYKGNRMDLGGHRFFSKSGRVNDLWLELMPLQGEKSFDDAITGCNKILSKDGPNPNEEDRVMLKRNRVSRIYYNRKFFDYPVSLSFSTLKNMGLVTAFECGHSYLKSVFNKVEENSLENFYINRFGKKLYSMFFKDYTKKLWGRYPREIDASWGAQRVKGVSIKAVLVDAFKRFFHIKNKRKETSLIEEFMYPKFGPGQMWEILADRVVEMGGRILFNTKVLGVNTEGNKATTVEYIGHGKKRKRECDFVLSSMPIKDLIGGMNDVPEDIMRIADGLPYRNFVTIGLLVKELEIKNETKIKTYNDSIPDCWIYVQDAGVTMGRIQVFNNWSPYMIEDAKNTIWLGLEYFCNERDEIWSMTEKDCAEIAINELARMGIIKRRNVLDFHKERARKAYPAYFDTYEEIPKVIDYLNSIENLYCIGRNGQHRYNNMDHSMLCAFEAVDSILSGNKDKTALWNVNSEDEYHEEK